MTFLCDNGNTVVLDRSTLGQTTCNPGYSICVEEFASTTIVETGERVDRADRDIRHGRLPRVEGCSVIEGPPPPKDGLQDDDTGYAIASVEAYPPGVWHFHPKTGEFVAEEAN